MSAHTPLCIGGAKGPCNCGASVTTLLERTFEHGFVDVCHDTDSPGGLFLQAAAHQATGFAFVPRPGVIALRDALSKWVFDTTPLATLTRRAYEREGAIFTASFCVDCDRIVPAGQDYHTCPKRGTVRLR